MSAALVFWSVTDSIVVSFGCNVGAGGRGRWEVQALTPDGRLWCWCFPEVSNTAIRFRDSDGWVTGVDLCPVRVDFCRVIPPPGASLRPNINSGKAAAIGVRICILLFHFLFCLPDPIPPIPTPPRTILFRPFLFRGTAKCALQQQSPPPPGGSMQSQQYGYGSTGNGGDSWGNGR